MVEDPGAIKDEWLGTLNSLVLDVQRWAQASGWRARRIQKTVEERPLGRYEVPVLLMEKDAVEVVLNPVARFVPGAEGAVDLYLSPAYDDIASLHRDAGSGRWIVHPSTATGVGKASDGNGEDPRLFDEATFRLILNRMIANA